jgi:hypothetical protein
MISAIIAGVFLFSEQQTNFIIHNSYRIAENALFPGAA